MPHVAGPAPRVVAHGPSLGGDRSPRSPALVIDAASTPTRAAAHRPAGPRGRGRRDQRRSPGLHDLPGQRQRSYYGEGPVPADPAVRWAHPGPARPVQAVLRRTGGLRGEGVVRHRMDRAAQRRPAGGRDPGPRRHVRRGLPLRRRRRRARPCCRRCRPATWPRARRRPTPTATRSTTPARATTCSGSSPPTVDPPEVLWTLDARTSVPEWKWNDDWDGAALVVDGYLVDRRARTGGST